MLGTSRKVRRLEKEAILRAKEYQYTREQSDNLLSNLNLNYEDDDTERHRRHVTTRPIRQIQREADYPVETMDKITERIQQELKRRRLSSSTTAPTTRNYHTSLSSSTVDDRAKNYHTSLSSSSVDDRANRDNAITGKYTSNKYTGSGKLH